MEDPVRLAWMIAILLGALLGIVGAFQRGSPRRRLLTAGYCFGAGVVCVLALVGVAHWVHQIFGGGGFGAAMAFVAAILLTIPLGKLALKVEKFLSIK